jgi:hypothetical protein
VVGCGWDEWLENLCFVFYIATSDPQYPTTVVPLSAVAAPVRNKNVAWFKEQRMVDVLRGFRVGDKLPPIEVDEPPTKTGFGYRVRDGFHRYYASAAAGFTELPVSVRPYFDINAL